MNETHTDRSIYLVTHETRTDLLLKIRERGLYVLGLLVASERPMSQADIETLTGWSFNTVTRTMRLLDHHGLAIRADTRGPWVPTLSGKSVFYGQPSTVEGSTLGYESSTVEGPTKFPGKSHRRQSLGPSTVEGSPTPGFKTLSRGHGPLVGGGGGVETPIGVDAEADPLGASRPRGDDPQPLRDDRAGLRTRQRWLACREIGINAPALDEIVKNDAIDPVFIFAHHIDARNQNLKLGAVIYRIRKFFTPSRQALREADERMATYPRVTCNHCSHSWQEKLELGEELSEFVFTCPKCGQEVES